MGLELRSYQQDGLEKLREGFAAGHRAQMLYLGTGGGKTEMAIALLEATKKKLNRSAMILDRIVLCNQTSERLDKYNIDHGVLMAGHWRNRPAERIQICSAQTLERRKELPDLKLLIVDEAHQTRAKTVEFIKNNPDVKVVGLSATPFTKGLGKIYDNVISTVTTKQLVDDKVLVPLKVYIAKEIDMEGATKVAGEWSQADATDRGMKITGDIVAEWIKKTHEIFGKPRKTIVFCSGVEHGIDLQKKFAAAGYNFVSISYKDDGEFKEDVIKDFAKADTDIHGLIATDILTKGFDCVLEGSRVLTERGLVAIDQISLNDKIWDGVEFVSHHGVIYKGVRDVITYAGLTATPDHKVKTAQGWIEFGECARRGIPIIKTGNGGQAIQEHEGQFSFGLSCQQTDQQRATDVRVSGLWPLGIGAYFHVVCASMGWLFGLRCSTVACSSMQGAERQMHESIASVLSGLWRTRNSLHVQQSKTGGAMDKEEYWNTRKNINQHTSGQDQQQWSLRTWKSTLVNSAREQLSYASKQVCRAISFVSSKLSRDQIRRQDPQKFDGLRPQRPADHREIPSSIRQAKGRVWDILNCGPRNCFTCEGLLIHNCSDVMIGVSARPFSKSLSSHIQQLGRVMRGHPGKEYGVWLDHSGNYIRFRQDWEDVYSNGVHALDDGREKAKKEPTKKEKEASKCPRCSALWTGGDTCHACGFVREKKNKVIDVSGELHELSGTMGGVSKQDFWSMMQYYKKYNAWSDGRMAHTYREKFGVWPRGLDATKVMTPSTEVSRFVDNKLKQYIKSIRGKR